MSRSNVLCGQGAHLRPGPAATAKTLGQIKYVREVLSFEHALIRATVMCEDAQIE
jgi:hypothetical protein